MTDSYCGKSCENCDKYQFYKCKGCKSELREQFADSCEISQCCKNLNHQSCDVCPVRNSCYKCNQREEMSDVVLERIDEKKDFISKAAALGEKINTLFILILVIIAASVLSFITDGLSLVALVPSLIAIGGFIAYAIILIQLGKYDERYRIAGILRLVNIVLETITAIFETLLIFIVSDAIYLIVSIILLIASAIIGVLAIKQEFSANADIVKDVDSKLSNEWTGMWKYYFVYYVGTIFEIIINILHIIFLRKTAKALEEYSKNNIIE
ncbi:MAG: DUF3795 domain-containing protein [Ruminococcaceae bacterium]|nr:DUF3795 domain-containing protein [Oscillospiraceae bacterium]